MRSNHTTLLLTLLFVIAEFNIVIAQPKRPNILFIAVDDLRPFDLPSYGNPVIKSPAINLLASQGFVFNNQYVAVPTCGASRCSMITGMYPKTREHLSNEASVLTISNKPKTEVPETFIDNLRRNGYYTVGIGKISHSADGYVYPYSSSKSNVLEWPYSWDEMLFDAGKWGTGWNAFFGYSDYSNRNAQKNMVKPYEIGEVHDEGYPDGLTANLAIKKLNELGRKEEPFFLAVGFFKPHLPFNAPKKYWDLYDESNIQLTPAPSIPKNINFASLNESSEFNGYKLGEEKATFENPLSDSYARKIRHAYYASVSYTDTQIGKLLTALSESGLDKNTIVVLWSDHGWHLGDNSIWGKHTLFDWALKNVFILKVPGMKGGKGINQITSAVDIYPSLMELCNVKMPHKTDGKSFVPLLRNNKKNESENVAYGYYNNGITMRTDRYRLTKYFRKKEPLVELYDHIKDPYENENIASKNPKLVNTLMRLLDNANIDLYKK